MRFAATHKAPHARNGADHIVPLQHTDFCDFIGIGAGSTQCGYAGRFANGNRGAEPSQGAAHVSPGEQNLYVVNGAVHFGLRPSPASLFFVAEVAGGFIDRRHRKDATMTRLQALPARFAMMSAFGIAGSPCWIKA